MKRRADQISDQAIREARAIRVEGTLIGDWPMRDGMHALVIRVPAETVVEIGGRE